MKKKNLALSILVMAMLTMNGCSGRAEPSKKSEQLKKEYIFYEESIGNIRNNMNLSPDEADEVFILLTSECGVEQKIQSVLKHGLSDSGTYDVWSGLKHLVVTVKDDNTVESVKEGGKQLYPVSEEQEKKKDEPEQTEKPTAKPTKKTKSKKVVLKGLIEGVVGTENLETFNYVPKNHFSLIKFRGSENITDNMTAKGMYLDIFNILKVIQKDINTDVDFNVVYPMVDQYGNTEDSIIIKATFKQKTIKKINFKNALWENVPTMADEWWNHPAVAVSE